ncbi:hypothetical protein NXX98_27315 [Bacteroides thetaiotaomicron]|uniref:hypothetical protein n=1 Tax=Bacteroides thetaiotaomicron TaxID=818 RepID=UPI00286EA048|nr:hypothetical protein [Bacteroides thetaiotaomicron]MCS3011419.1 hypothetical protein [Bacteroides thetaiotaomicron]
MGGIALVNDSEYIDYPAYANRIDPNPRREGFVTEDNKDQFPELGNHRVGVSMQYVEREPRFYALVLIMVLHGIY